MITGRLVDVGDGIWLASVGQPSVQGLQKLGDVLVEVEGVWLKIGPDPFPNPKLDLSVGVKE